MGKMGKMGKMNWTEDRFLNRSNLVSFGFITLFLHVLVSVQFYFFEARWLFVIDCVCLGLLGFAAVLYFAREQQPLRVQPAQTILCAFFLWYIISCLSMTVTYNNDWVNYNAEAMRYTAVSLFLAFPLGYVAIREKKNAVGEILLHTALLAWTVFMLFILINAFMGRNIPLPNGGSIYMKEGSLWMNAHRNTTGAWEMVFFLGCSFMAFFSKKRWVKAIYIIASVIHYVGLTFSNSRASILATMAGFAAMTGIYIYLRLEKKNTKHRLLIAVGAGLVAGAAFYYLRTITVYPLYSAAIGTKESGRTIINTSDTSFSGRTKIWGWAISGITSSFRTFMFGVTPPSIPELISQISGKPFTETWTHNEFLEIAAGIGVPGMCMFIALLVILAIDIWKMYFIRKEKSMMLCIPVMFLVLLAANMMESYLLFYNYLGGYMFFLLGGMLHGYVNGPARPFRIPEKLRLGKARKNARMSGQA